MSKAADAPTEAPAELAPAEPAPRMAPHHTALRSLFLVAMHHGRQLKPDELDGADEADTMGSVLRIMRGAGFKARRLGGRDWRAVTRLGAAYPAMAVRRDGDWLIVIGTVVDAGGDTSLAILDPAAEGAGPRLCGRTEFMRDWDGTLVLAKRRRRSGEEARQPFGLRWFLPEIARQGRYFRDITVAAVMLNLLGLATPMLFQVIINKVIPYHSTQTLRAVVIVFVAVMLFDAVFGYARQHLMLFATSKIDARLASRTFEKLLALPMQFFESTPAGVLARNMQQTEKLRHFLTGRLFQTVLDALALPVLLVLLACYSAKLTMVVLGFAALIAAFIAVMVPLFRTQLQQLYQAEGMRQSYLIETIHGMRTVKSLAMEAVRKTAWDARIVVSLRRNMAVGRIGALAATVTGTADKLMQIVVIGLGAADVFDGQMSVGALVAFTMLSGRVSGPLLQIVGLINEYQETALSVRMLGTVMDHPPERDPRAEGIRPAVSGRLEFDSVSFRYPGALQSALERVSFAIEPGEVIGVVGRSGSGKTTLTRLIQGIHTAQGGMIRIDGADIRHVDLGHLRRNIGVVLQDSFLFRGSIRDNIAASRPGAPLHEIVLAAELAGAAEFIDRLPLSYDTVLEEGASNLSGGQRQRLAIARALLVRPRLLVFDEATSALDPESEAVVQANLAEIARDRTLIVVSHRLSSLVRADRILVLEHGLVLDFAPHETLLQRCDMYRRLWRQQTGHLGEASSCAA